MMIVCCFSDQNDEQEQRIPIHASGTKWIQYNVLTLFFLEMHTDKGTNCILLGPVDCDSFYKWIPLNRWLVAISLEVLYSIYIVQQSLPICFFRFTSLLCYINCNFTFPFFCKNAYRKPIFHITILQTCTDTETSFFN